MKYLKVDHLPDPSNGERPAPDTIYIFNELRWQWNTVILNPQAAPGKQIKKGIYQCI